MSTVGAIGIDLGGNTAVVAISRRAGVEIVTNEASQRETPVVVGFGQTERFIGEQAHTQLKSNFKNTVLFPNRLLGVKPDAPFLNEEKKWLYSPLALTEDNRIAYEISVRGEKQLILPEQAVAMFLQKLRQFVVRDGVLTNDVVLSVPGYYTEQEKKALLDAAKVAKINVTKLMSEPTAIAAGYGMFRRNEFGNQPRNVLFIDLGHCKTSAFVASFTKDKVSVLNQVHERNLGVRDLDWKLLEFYVDLVHKKYGSNIINKEKPRLRLLDAIEKQRKILSANSEATLNVDNIVEDEDLAYNLTRENYEGIITPVLQRFQDALLQLRSEIKVPIHSVEIIGGGTRIPIVQRIIQEIFKCECLRTLNASECVARGCAIQSVLLNPLYKGAPYTIEDSNYYPIVCSWTFKPHSGSAGHHHQFQNDPNKQIALLFPKGAPIPCAKGLTFHRDADIDVRLFYANPAPPGADELIAQYFVHGQKAKTHDFGIKVVVALNKHGISELESAKLLEDVYEDKLAPGGHRAQNRGGFGGFGGMGGFWPGGGRMEQEEEVKKKKQTYTTDLKAEVSNFNVMDQRMINELADYENKMAQQDRLIQETYDKRNELEAYVYDVRNKINDKYDQYIRPEFKANILQNLNDVEAWLYGDGAKASKIEYQAKLDQLRGVVNSIEKRYRDFEMIPQYINQFANNLTSTEQLLTSQGSSVSGQDKTQLVESINNNKGWLEEVNRRVSNANRMDDPPVSSDEIQNRMREFMNVRTAGGLA